MLARKMRDGIYEVGVVDWDRRLFDALVPLPEGTSYNAYFIEGGDRNALIDGADPAVADQFFSHLNEMRRVDVIISQHTEQDHSGVIPEILRRHPQAQIYASPSGRNMLLDLLDLPPERITAVKDGETLDLGGGRVLKFLSTPWVHWPDTMCTWLERDRVLFTCDLFGSHMASSELFARDEPRVLNAAKRYFAEIMMPCGKAVPKAVDKVAPLQPDIIAPSHGPVFDRPQLILDAYRRWTVAPPENLVVLPHVSMHGSTRLLVDRMTEALGARGVRVERFDLLTLDPGLLATALVDAATLVLGTPAMLHSLHPHAGNAARLINTLRPKLKYVAAVGSYGWNGKLFDELATFFPDLKVESLGTVTCKGLPRPSDIEAVDRLADLITERHRSLDSAV